MTLTSQTKIGLTFGQALALVTTVMTNVGVLFYAYMVINIRLNSLENQKEQDEKAYQENREEHNKLFVKVDDVYKIVANNKKGS